MLTTQGLEVEAEEAPNDAEAKLLGLKFTGQKKGGTPWHLKKLELLGDNWLE